MTITIRTVSVVRAKNHTTMWMMKKDFGLGVISVIDGIAVSVKALQKNQHLRLIYATIVSLSLWHSLCLVLMLKLHFHCFMQSYDCSQEYIYS